MVSAKIKQGDIIMINLNPVRGHEQAGYRPALVISNMSHSRASNMTIICPITKTDRKSPLHVQFDGQNIKGFVMCDQVKSIDTHARDYKIVESVGDETLWEVSDIVQGSVDVEK